MFKKVLFVSVVFLFLGITVFLGMTDEPLVDTVAQLEQAEAYVDNSEYEQAEAIYKTIIQDYPGTDYALEAQTNLVILYINWDKPAQAEAAFDELVAEFSAHKDIAQAVYDIAYCYGELHKNYEKARQLHQYVIENWPDSEVAIWSQTDLATCSINLADDPNAEAAIEELLTEFSDHNDIAPAVYAIAGHYGGLQQYEKAREFHQYVLENWPNSEVAIWAQRDVAALNIDLGDDPNAQAAIEKLLTEFSENNNIAGALYYIADSYRELQQYEKAQELYQYVIENWPQPEGTIWSQVAVAMSNIVLGDDPNAQAVIDKLIADFNGHPDLPEALYDIAVAYEDLRRYEESKSIYQQIIQQSPDSPEVRKAQLDIPKTQILLFISDGNETAAEAGINSLITNFNGLPDLPETISRIEEGYYINILAVEEYFREDFLNPVEVWEKVMRRVPDFFHDDPDLYYFIADCYRQLGEYEKAIEYYGIVAANWTQNGYAVLSNAVVPRAEDDAAGVYEALHATIDRLIADFGAHPGLACVVTRSGHGYRRRANDARREGLSTEAQADNLKAIGLYDRVINEFGSSGFVATSYFFSALAYRDLGQWQDALDCCNRLLDNWPEYKYATWARRLAQECSERLDAPLQ